MDQSAFHSDFALEDTHIRNFQRKGFVKLGKFLSLDTIRYLRARVDHELNEASPNFQDAFNRLKYDFTSKKDDLYRLINEDFFQCAMSRLTGRTLFFTFEICFELKKNESRGFPWHVGVQSFGYQKAEDFGCTIWVPLHAIDTRRQHGGMAYVPRDIVSGRFVYEDIEPALVGALERKAEKGIPTTLEDYFFLRTGILNSPAMVDILDQYKEEDDFELGDVLVFDKYVIHRSMMLNEGELERRSAFVMRFVDVDSRYDLPRALNLEYPTRQYGYRAFTRSHLEVGMKDGEVLSESPYFDAREKRIISAKCPGID